jgi:hypothetical protein
MPLVLYNGALLVKNGSLTTDLDCCCKEGCPIGQLAVWAYYFTDSDKVEVGVDEETMVNEVIAEFEGKHFGFDMHVAFWVGNPFESPDPVTGKYYYGEFQIWLVANCCESCDDFQYENKAEGWAYDWPRITDPASQFAWDPPWAVGSCAGLTIENDEGIQILYDCVESALDGPDSSDAATGAFILRESIEVCCDYYYEAQ